MKYIIIVSLALNFSHLIHIIIDFLNFHPLFKDLIIEYLYSNSVFQLGLIIEIHFDQVFKKGPHISSFWYSIQANQ